MISSYEIHVKWTKSALLVIALKTIWEGSIAGFAVVRICPEGIKIASAYLTEGSIGAKRTKVHH